ncbi:isochorismatase hydrolase [Phanerochaete sordida]|uniref:Isochorismatase hydrolase n=1 Tax=Phanerochaete sordida TaxID=48140 RepID=A0A9P3L9X1_9APHY|nr:isochorismatase hydrolase [Phanerochaete sordida]
MTSTPHSLNGHGFVKHRPPVPQSTEYGNATNFWVEYPSGLVDLTRTVHLPEAARAHDVPEQPDEQVVFEGKLSIPPLIADKQWEVEVDGDRSLRLSKAHTAIVIIDMQNYFLHPDLRDHPTGLDCVLQLMNVVPALRTLGAKILWVNWGLTDHELSTIPPSLVRGFMKGGKGGFGAELPGAFGRLLMRNEYNSALYGPLQHLYEQGHTAGSDVWIHKNRMSGLWGPQSALDLYLQESGITTLFFAGVNADQCVLGTIVDSYFRGYDCIALQDCIATTSPEGGLENVLYNCGNSYGFITDSDRVVKATEKKL